MNRERQGEQGSILVGLLVVMIAISGFASILLTRSTRVNTSASATAEAVRLLFVAEAGVNLNYVEMEADPYYAVKDEARFAWDAGDKEFVSGLTLLKADTIAKQRSFRLAIQYLTETGVPIEFADRANPVEEFKEVRVRAEATSARGRRIVTAWYLYNGYAIRGALNSDLFTTSSVSGNGRTVATLGHVVFTGDGDNNEFHIYGDVVANAKAVYFDDDSSNAATARTEITNPSIAAAKLMSTSGEIDTGLAGTDGEVPDFTIPGSQAQLFDFSRLEAAAAAGAGAIYQGTQAFNDAMATANALGQPMEGIIVVKIDPASSHPDFTVDINITGTLVVSFGTGTSPTQKILITGSLNINAADLTTVVPANENTFTSGYPGAYADPLKKPSSVDISPVFKNFSAREDLPALVCNSGVLDIHGPVNVCGVVYAASFVEIENQSGLWQYFNGAIYSGGGIWLSGSSGVSNSAVMVRWDSSTLDRLETHDFGGGKELVRTAYMVSQK